MATSKISKEFLQKSLDLGSGTIDANGTAEISASAALSGYKAIGILRIYKTGDAHGRVVLSRFYISPSEQVVVTLCNTSSTARSFSVQVGVLYEKSN